MFRKIVSNLPFSPALVGQLSFYAKRLRKEEMTRRLGLIFIAMALVVQSLAVFQPPESANASSETDMVSGGLGTSLNNFLKPYDANTKYLRDVMNYTGITRDEIASAKLTTFVTGSTLSWGFASRFSYAQGERQHNITDINGNKVTTVYSRPLELWGSETKVISAWVGTSQSMGWFAIMQSCGNLVTTKLPPPPPTPPKMCIFNPKLLESDQNCLPCPGDETIWINDESCVPNIINSKTATNASQGFVNASSVIARSGDQINYTIVLENTGLSPQTVKFEDHLGDVLEYAKLSDNGGGTLNNDTKTLSWPQVVLNPKNKQTRTFAVTIFNDIPATASGASDPTSYDCNISNIFGNVMNVKIDCPVPKIVEKVTSELPKTGPTENIIFSGIILAIATYFYARTRQVKKEVYLIRKDVGTGTL